MKRIILLILFVILSKTTFAQFRFGAKLAYSQNILSFTEDLSITSRPFISSANGGFVANYTFTKVLSIQSELLFNSTGGNFDIHTPLYQNLYGDIVYRDTHVKIRLQYLEIPLLAKFTIFGKQKVNFNILAGPFAGYRLSAKQQINSDSFQNVHDDYTTFNAGYCLSFGLSCMKQRLFFEMRGNRGLVNINTTEGKKINTFQMNYTVGYYLFQGKNK